jgi:hypothetical protein
MGAFAGIAFAISVVPLGDVPGRAASAPLSATPSPGSRERALRGTPRAQRLPQQPVRPRRPRSRWSLADPATPAPLAPPQSSLSSLFLPVTRRLPWAPLSLGRRSPPTSSWHGPANPSALSNWRALGRGGQFSTVDRGSLLGRRRQVMAPRSGASWLPTAGRCEQSARQVRRRPGLANAAHTRSRRAETGPERRPRRRARSRAALPDTASAGSVGPSPLGTLGIIY